MIGNVVVEESEIELHVQRLLEQLPGQVHARFGCVDVLVQAQDQIVRHNGIAGGEERYETLDEVAIGRAHAPLHVTQINLKIDFFHAPGILDGGTVHLIELRIAHGPKGEIETGIE